jgi:carboxyl-terminal processing protease
VWSKVDEVYLYEDFRGVDWQGVREQYAPRVAAAPSSQEFYLLLAEMVGELHDGHSRFIPPAEVQVEDTNNTGDRSGVGIGVLTMALDDGALVQQVFPASPAAQAGLRPRDLIVGIDGQDYTVTDNQIEGPDGSLVRLDIKRPGATPFEVTLTRRAVQGRIEPQARRLGGGIGYLGIPTLWVNDMSSQVAGALTDLVAESEAQGALRGLIIDLRGNRGGWREVLQSVMGHFVRGNVGTFFNQRAATPLLIDAAPGPDLTHLPLIVLIDQRSASYAEVLAAVLQERGRARVVGLPSAGNTETAYGYDFEDGSRLWVAQEGFRLRSGSDLEGSGVQPDVLIDADWTRYSEDEDPYILAALALLQADGDVAENGP